MTTELVTTLEADRTRAVPFSASFAPKPMNIILVVGAMALCPTSATASTLELPVETRRIPGGWTNSGNVIPEAAAVRSFADSVLEVRKRSGLTWEQLASLFGVDRRSVHLWASGRPLSAQNGERLGRVLGIVRRGDRGTPSATKAWLTTPGPNGRTPLDLLREGRFEEIATPGSPVVAPRPRPLSAAAKHARAPQTPEGLVGARSERVHVQKGILIASVPLKITKPK